MKWISYENGMEGTYTENDLHFMYVNEVNHNEENCGYPTFEGWLYDMEKLQILNRV